MSNADNQSSRSGPHAYLPIEDYGIIGNLRTAALVGRNGSIDWCCFPYLDGPSVFGALLDVNKGGRFKVAPMALKPGPSADAQDASSAPGIATGRQSYRPNTNVLVTRFTQKETELLTVTDFMPLAGDIEGPGKSQAAPEIHRLLECQAREVEVEVQWAPRFDYARDRTRIRKNGEGYIAEGKTGKISLSPLPGATIETDAEGALLRARFTMQAGASMVLVTRWDSEDTHTDVNRTQALLEQTATTWENWVQGEGGFCARDWAGEWLPYVNRSSLVFKLLTHADTGAVAAAATTSLPEEIGGVRNWDYRYAWIRDASMTAQALVSVGHPAEATALIRWMEEISAQRDTGRLHLLVMYGLHGEVDISEEQLDHLEGYRRSAPVRIGNEAAEQFQLEVFGELVNAAYEMARRGVSWRPEIQRFIRHVADEVCQVWHLPDSGIWEVRNDTFHFTYSKIMAWVALDRAVRLVKEHGFEGDVESWCRTCDEIREKILEHGYNERLGSFVMTFDSEDLDAALLRIPLMEFLPVDDPRVQGTINRIMEGLMEKDLVYRYRIDDGLPGEEGTFGLCTFWLVDVLSLAGRIEEATRIFEGMLEHASPLGLFAEEIDPHTMTFLGNYPQAFTHIGLINSALYLSWSAGKPLPEHPPMGTEAHRQREKDQ